MPQSAEHLAALDALGVTPRPARRHPRPTSPTRRTARAAALAQERIAKTSLGTVEAVAVSGAHRRRPRRAAGRARPAGRRGFPRPTRARRCGSGSTARSPSRAAAPWSPARSAPARCAAGDTLALGGRDVRVRGPPVAGRGHRPGRRRGPGRGQPPEPAQGGGTVGATRCSPRARSGTPTGRRAGARRPGRRPAGRPWPSTSDRPPSPRRSARSASDTARLRLQRALPLRIGDRALLRDPGRHHVAGGVTVLDPLPPPLRRRGAAAARAAELATMDGGRTGAASCAGASVATGRRPAPAGRAGRRRAGWLADDGHRALLRPAGRGRGRRATRRRTRWSRPCRLEALRRALGLPDRALVEAVGPRGRG